MKNTYCIGKFRFDSYPEYRKGLEDIEKIRYISEKTDINEPGMAKNLYTLMREGKITFQSVIGQDYMLYLSDLMVEDYQAETEKRQRLEEKRKEKRKKRVVQPRRISPRQVVGIFCMAGAVVSFLIVLTSEYHDRQKIREMEEMKTQQEIAVVSDWISSRVGKKLEAKRAQETGEETVVAESKVVENQVHAVNLEAEPQKPQILPEYQSMYNTNPDLAGWITIEGTRIDYPVMQSSAENPEYYLNYNFDKKEDINGSLFMDARNDFAKPDVNLIVYGHNMKSGMMFGGLKQYLDKEYWKSHKTIQFNTLYERAEYEIVAVCLSKVSYQDDQGFRYYDFLNVEDEAVFEACIKSIKECNVMDEPVDISFGDELLTLSTCSNYTEDGRLYLVARKRVAE